MSLSMGQIIKNLRKSSGFTQEELAERLGVTYQAVSKWENDAGLPDISQVVPLASIFGVSTDALFGIADMTGNEDVQRIVSCAADVKKYGEPETYLEAYDILRGGLRKYSGNMTLAVNAMRLGVSLTLPENGRIYAGERKNEIAAETIRQANFVIANSKNIGDVLSARQILVYLYCSQGRFDAAAIEAGGFPPRTDLTLFSHLAVVSEYMNDYKSAEARLCSDIDYMLQALENDMARLGKAYAGDGKYTDAIAVYETFFEIMKAVFRDEIPLSYHDFDSGDCRLLLAEAYLAIGDASKAMDAVEASVMYYIDLYNAHEEEIILPREGIKSPVLRETMLTAPLPKESIKQKLLYKLSADGIQALNREPRFKKLLDIVNDLP